jgi:hypothetical protein
MPVANAFGASVMRATSVPSAVAATRNADRPRSTPIQPPSSAVAGRVVVGGVEVGGLDVQ